MTTQTPGAKILTNAIRVETATSVSGPCATTISVEVDSALLKNVVKGSSEILRVFAVVPEVIDGKPQWREEELQAGGSHFNAQDRRMETFSAVVRGPTDVDEKGIGVGLQTASETVWASAADVKLPSHAADEEAK